MASEVRNVVVYEGSNSFRQRVILSTLSGKSTTIRKIRHKDQNPGVREYEVSVMRLLEQLTKGCKMQFSESSTRMHYDPGMLHGGKVEHACNPSRAIGYYLEVLVCLAPFMKIPLKCTLTGVTNNDTDTSIDIIKLSTLPVLKRFLGTDEGLELKVIKRGAAPDGGGQVFFSCPVRQKLRPIQFIVPGKIKRIRGIAWATRVDPRVCNRMVDAARVVLNKCLPDIYIYTDHCRGENAGKSPGFGITLVAETIEGAFLSAEQASTPKGSLTDENPTNATIPEDLATTAALLLLDEIRQGGCVDSSTQGLACLMMTLGDRDVSKIQTGPLTDYAIQMLRHIRDFFQVTFKIDVDKTVSDLALGDDKLILTCTGVGFRNLSKVIL